MYFFGEEISTDYKKAKYWYLKSAELGTPESMVNLGVMYRNGTGVMQDNVLAHMWFNLASAEGNTNAKKFMKTISKSMTVSQIATAQQLAHNCVKGAHRMRLVTKI